VVSVVLELFPAGCLKSLRATGHAGKEARGNDLVCAAVTILIRTTLHALSREKSLTVTGAAPREGEATINVLSYDAAVEERFRGLSDFLLTGLFDLAAENPGHLTVRFHSQSTEA
jgi:uncharacterized protein YsxB (DUF464 family)